MIIALIKILEDMIEDLQLHARVQDKIKRGIYKIMKKRRKVDYSVVPNI
jgi:predicted DNA-binding protein